jgi:hypothetical protein
MNGAHQNKTPGGERYLDPPGAEICEPGHECPSKLTILVAVLDDDLIDEHVVAIFDVVNVNLRIFSDFRSFDHSSICGRVSNGLAELITNRLGRFSFQEKLLSRSEFRDDAIAFGCGSGGFSHSIGPRRNGGGG